MNPTYKLPEHTAGRGTPTDYAGAQRPNFPPLAKDLTEAGYELGVLFW